MCPLQLGELAAGEPKYAPKFCTRLRFNCNNKQESCNLTFYNLNTILNSYTFEITN